MKEWQIFTLHTLCRAKDRTVICQNSTSNCSIEIVVRRVLLHRITTEIIKVSVFFHWAIAVFCLFLANVVSRRYSIRIRASICHFCQLMNNRAGDVLGRLIWHLLIVRNGFDFKWFWASALSLFFHFLVLEILVLYVFHLSSTLFHKLVFCSVFKLVVVYPYIIRTALCLWRLLVTIRNILFTSVLLL